MEVLCGAPVETPDRAEMGAPMLLRWGGGWALHFLTDPAQHCRSQNHHTGPDSMKRQENSVTHDIHSVTVKSILSLWTIGPSGLHIKIVNIKGKKKEKMP